MIFSIKFNHKKTPKNIKEKTENINVPIIILFKDTFNKILEYNVVTIPAKIATKINAMGRFSTPYVERNKAFTVGFTISKVEIIRKI